MSAKVRSELSKMQRNFAKKFDLPLNEVEIEEWPDDDGCVWAPNYPDLPQWTVGKDVSN